MPTNNSTIHLAQDVLRQSPYPMIPIDEALKLISSKLQPLSSSLIPTSQSLNRILADDIHAPSSLPPFRASIKDGFAIKFSNSSSSVYTVIGESLAGTNPYGIQLKQGEAMYVTTGAPIPNETDAVVMVENTKPAEKDQQNCIIIENTPKIGTDIREIGSDIMKHDVVLTKGTMIGAAEIGILISCAITNVSVLACPTIGVLSTGDELVDVTDLESVLLENEGKLPYGKIIDSNRLMLISAIKESLPFCQAIDLGIVKDDLEYVRRTMKNAMDSCDIVISSGGVSMGNKDFIKQVISELATIHFGRVRMKPGKPLTFATTNTNGCFIGLPGNPVSSFVCFHLAVGIAARTLAGWPLHTIQGNVVQVKLGMELSMDSQRVEYHRASVKVS